MLERFSQFAERAATNVSRRQFLGRLGRGAITVAAALSGLLVLATDCQAARKVRICPEGSCCGCAGVQEGSPCSIDPENTGICKFNKKSGVCDCVEATQRGKPPPKDKA